MHANMLVIAIVAGLYWFLGRIFITYTFSYMLAQPISQALVFGLLFGNVKEAMLIGVAVELVYVGVVAAGAQFPSDETLAGCIAIPIALATGIGPEMAVAIAVPFGALGVLMDQIRRTIHTELAHLCDKAAEKGDDKAIARATTVYPYIIGFLLRFPFPFLIVYFGADTAQKILDVLPEWVMTGLSTAGGVLPAMGFAIILMLIGKATLMPFFFVGFFLVQYFGISTMTAAVFGIPIAIGIVLMKHENNKQLMDKVDAIVEDSE